MKKIILAAVACAAMGFAFADSRIWKAWSTDFTPDNEHGCDRKQQSDYD